MRSILPLLLMGACALPDDDLDGDGWSVGNGDCDDLDPNIHPGAIDELADGIDQDCDGSNPRMVVQGDSHSCQLDDDLGLMCSGDNSMGQLDVPDSDFAWVKITAGQFHTCALGDQGDVACWGDDTWGQSTPPETRVWADVNADSDYTIGVRPEGLAMCWGRCIGHQLP